MEGEALSVLLFLEELDITLHKGYATANLLNTHYYHFPHYPNTPSFLSLLGRIAVHSRTLSLVHCVVFNQYAAPCHVDK
jgi:hypothetical protein